MRKCPNCNSTNIERGLTVGSGDSKTGLKYLAFAIPKVELFYADLCKKCGNVRLYVKNTERDWS